MVCPAQSCIVQIVRLRQFHLAQIPGEKEQADGKGMKNGWSTVRYPFSFGEKNGHAAEGETGTAECGGTEVADKQGF